MVKTRRGVREGGRKPVAKARELLARAVTLYGQGAYAEAKTLCRDALGREPGQADALNLLGMLRYHEGRFQEASKLIEKALKGSPDNACHLSNLCHVLNCQQRYEEAAAAGLRAMALAPEEAAAANNCGNALAGARRQVEALEVFERVVALDPARLNALKQGLSLARTLGDFAAEARWRSRLEVAFTSGRSFPAEAVTDFINLAYLDVIQPLPAGIFGPLTGAIDRVLSAQAAPLPQSAPSDPKGRVRLGYLSGNFGDHPIGHVIQELFAAHDRDRFEVHGLSLQDRLTEKTHHARKIKDSFEFFHDLSALPPGRAAGLVAGLDLDVALYLDGFMNPKGLGMMSFRPGRARAFWLGHAGGLGLSFIEHLVADAAVLPPAEEPLYRERIVRLPEIYHCASPQAGNASPPSREECGLPREGAVFCGFNNPEKINPETFGLWMEILRLVPASVLWLSNPFGQPKLEENLRREAAARGVAGERLVFAERVPDKAAHLARHDLADVFLDAWPLNASTTALDALWAGVPLLTFPGNRFGARIAADMLQALGLADLVCSDPRAVIARAAGLAGDASARAVLKDRIRSLREAAPLFQIERFTRNLETVIMEMSLAARSNPPGRRPPG